jgi:hypothetical protein
MLTQSITHALNGAAPATSLPIERARLAEADRAPLFQDGWLEFNRLKWGVEPRRVRLSPEGSGVPAIEAVYYLDRRGRIWKPPTSPYAPLAFHSTEAKLHARVGRQWQACADLLAADMARCGVANDVALPPEVADVRAWQWAGFRTAVRYTFYVDLPHDPAAVEPSVRRQIAKAQRGGFTCRQAPDLAAAFACITESQTRGGFDHRIGERDLVLALETSGEEAFRVYVCYAPDGQPAAARVILHHPGGRAVDWLVGTRSAYLSSGATQYLLDFVLMDLVAHGAIGLDLEGANLPSVAASKATWGAYLVPYYLIEPLTPRGFVRHGRDYVRFRRRQR